ncbi:MAG: hypothetical protein Ct9H90mP27_5010 [Gammaproteobacteria bacterium]|nr:MAG: hypothetical protein Ct9H90mP27_5010 [Gammaproteobacteria bacterium]
MPHVQIATEQGVLLALLQPHVQTAMGLVKSGFPRVFSLFNKRAPKGQGPGKNHHGPCRSCGGGGRVEKSKTLSVKVPAGVDKGTD